MQPSGAQTDATSETASADAGTDTPPSDGRSFDANELTAFTYSWYGTGVSGAFELNADCGITTKGRLYYTGPLVEGAGVVPPVECDSFKQLCVSAAVTDALKTVDAAGCASDDYPNVTITLSDGSKIMQPGTGCSEKEPYTTLRPRVEALRKYADAGVGG